MDKNKKIFSFDKAIFKDRKTLALIIMCIMGILFMIFSSSMGEKTDTQFDDREYVSQLEGKLEGVLQNIDGVGKCQVMITLENGTEYVYSDTFSSSGSKLLKSVEPTVKGVAVICTGGDNIKVKQNIINTLKSVLNITSARISVCKMNNN